MSENKQREYRRTYYLKHKAEINAQSREYYAQHKEEAKSYSKEYYARNKEEHKAKVKEYRKSHPENTTKPGYGERKRRGAKQHLNRRREMVNAVAMHYGCRSPICQSTSYTPEELDFHHLGDTKEFSVSQRLFTKKSKIAAEINKCVVLCANCHRRFHAGRFTLDESHLCLVDEELKPIYSLPD